MLQQPGLFLGQQPARALSRLGDHARAQQFGLGAVQHLQRRIDAARGRSMQEDLAQQHHVIERGGGAGLVFRTPLLGVAHQILHRELGGL
ncbi:hypothetical protein [Delftia acidovorans]|uniref:hypothetical protein n=1 Tax=Delftia acidovorans TaxID=80866 RepID=UPI0028B03FB2|nr:hypothetical protein [Delftia acidovorans]